MVKALHRPLTLFGVDRRLFFLALMAGAAAFNLFYSFLAGLLVTGTVYVSALLATWHDPQFLAIVLAASRSRRRYDLGKHALVDVEVRR
ncbi:MAG: VirB3 family type IV secretion system protein [Vicinamibacterales bacterium]